MTWGEIKRATLGKLEFDDRAPNGEYAGQMTDAANEAIALLEITCGSPTKQMTISAEKDVPIDLSVKAPDFYEVVSVMKNDGTKRTETLGFKTDGGANLRMQQSGNFTIVYTQRAEKLTDNTADTREIGLEREAAAIIPLYIASQIYKHDNAQLAMIWRNEFEVFRQELMKKYHAIQKGKIEFE